MKLLYLSCHSILEHDEIKLFHELGIDVYSHGAYTNPIEPGDMMRPPLDWGRDLAFEEMAKANPKDNMSKEFLDHFDVVMFSWMPDWLRANLHKLEDKIVIMRTIGQSIAGQEQLLAQFKERGVKIVRYSPREERIPYYAGGDAIIRFYKDHNEWMGWNGMTRRIMNLTQSMMERWDFCGWEAFNAATIDLPRVLFGRGNQAAGDLWGGQLTTHELHLALQNHRCYLYTGTYPASYTLSFIEAWMTGIPIVAVGEGLGNAAMFNQQTYEITDLIQHGVNGFVSDNIQELHDCCQQLLNDQNLADKISKAGRESAIATFGKEPIKQQWAEFFKGLM